MMMLLLLLMMMMDDLFMAGRCRVMDLYKKDTTLGTGRDAVWERSRLCT